MGACHLTCGGEAMDHGTAGMEAIGPCIVTGDTEGDASAKQKYLHFGKGCTLSLLHCRFV